MIDQDVREFLERMAAEEPVPRIDAEPLTRRARRRAVRTVVVGAVGVAAAVAALFGGVAAIRTAPIPAIPPTPPPAGPVLRTDGEVLWHRGGDDADLLAVNPATGDERVLVEGLDGFDRAAWSADGRWVAYEMWSGTSRELWVVGADLEPRNVMDLGPAGSDASWVWSSSGARLAVVRDSTLWIVDPASGPAIDLASAAGVDSAPAWSPDGSRIVLGAAGGTISTVDVRTGEGSVLAELPGEDLAGVDAMAWSPDGSRLAVFSDLEPGTGRLFVLNADGSDARVVAQEELVIQLDWSPDGSRIVFAADALEAPRIDIWVANADGTPAYLVASPSYPGYNGWGSPVWSPDGAQIGFSVAPNRASSIDADGSGDAVPIDDLTYASWSGGSFCATCAVWRGGPIEYTGPSDG